MKKGFTLAETVLGLLFLGILLVVVGGVFIGGVSAAKKGEKKVTNVILASGMMDNIMLTKYSNILIDPNNPNNERVFDGTKPDAPVSFADGSVFPPLPYPVEIDASNNKRNYYYKIKTKPVGTSGKLKRIKVTVISKGTDGEPDTEVTLESLKAQ